MGLDVYLYQGKVKIERNSTKYPDHMFKIGYLRSSYNDGGINTVLRNAGLHDLNEIFTPNNEYEFQPNWDEALARAKYVLDRWHLRQDSDESKYYAFKVSMNPFSGDLKMPNNERDALLFFMEQLAKHKKDDKSFLSYSCANGHFMLDGIKVFGLVYGQDASYMGSDACTYVIAENVNREDDWYGKALEIVVEMCEWVLAQQTPEQFWLHWSG